METNTYCKEIVANIEEYHLAMFGFDPETLRQGDIAQFMVDLAKLTEEDRSDLALKLMMHIYSVQFKVNKVTALITYLKDKMRHLVAGDLLQYKGTSWEYAEVLAIQNNDVAIDLAEKIREYTLIKDSSNNILTILTDIARKIEGMKYAKKF